jgi:hypothetical protein
VQECCITELELRGTESREEWSESRPNDPRNASGYPKGSTNAPPNWFSEFKQLSHSSKDLMVASFKSRTTPKKLVVELAYSPTMSMPSGGRHN